MVDLHGYVIMVVKTLAGNTKLFGSPADRAELEVGDEIIAVNGQVVEGCTHSEIISHIHKCIQSKTIKLRVRRSSLDTETDPISSDINDAYVIAVDEEAKSRLEQLSALHKVKAVDIATLQDLGNNNLKDPEVVSNHRLSCVPEESSSHTESQCESCTDLNPPESDINPPESDTNPPDTDLSLPETVQPSEETCTADDPADIEVSQVIDPDHCDLDIPHDHVHTESDGDNSDTVDAMETTAVVNGYQDNSYHLAGPINSAYRDRARGTPAMKYPGLAGSQDNMYDSMELDEVEYKEEQGPHREMAIDCPPSFVGVKKETPRFPRGYTNPNYSARKSGDPNRSSQDLDSSYQMPPAAGDDHEQLERIKKYQDDLRRRREEEERISREQEFLRTSLRGSKKLQALEEERRENYPPPSGIINPNYVEEEDSLNTSRAATLPVRQHHGTDALVHQPLGKEVLLTQLHHFQKKLRSIEDQKDIAFLHGLFQNPRFHHAMSTYNKVAEVTLHTAKPSAQEGRAADTSQELLDILPKHPPNTFVQELRVLLQHPHIKGLLRCHDNIAQHQAEAASNAMEEDEREYLYERASQYGDEIKIVRLQKTADPLGATVRNDGDRVLIGRIVKGGAAEKSGLLHEGDEILEINGNDIRGKSVNDVCDLMASLTGTLTFLIIPSLDQRPTVNSEIMMHIRAHFNYDPEDDLYIPCRELGISFEKGDILHVLNQEDANWWQAYREGEEDQSLAGLIPSKNFQEQKESMKQMIAADKNEDSKKRQRCRCTRKNPKKKKKQLYNESGEETEEILTYEEVALYNPQPNRKRPIVLVGPPNVGRQDLRQRLMETDEDRFGAAIPHTSRPRKEDEEDSKDYHFVSKEQFEQDIDDHKFVEYGQFVKNFYGTSLEAIREVVNSGKICILNLYPESLRVLKASDLKPYVVFIAPPNIEKLKQLRQKQGVKVTDNELIEIIEKAREMEELYGHLFDQFIMNYDLDRAYHELISEINRLEVEPQWVPSHWVT